MKIEEYGDKRGELEADIRRIAKQQALNILQEIKSAAMGAGDFQEFAQLISEIKND